MCVVCFWDKCEECIFFSANERSEGEGKGKEEEGKEERERSARKGKGKLEVKLCTMAIVTGLPSEAG